MNKTTANNTLEESAREMRELVVRSKQKLLEFETLMSLDEIKQGKSEKFSSAQELIKSLT